MTGIPFIPKAGDPDDDQLWEVLQEDGLVHRSRPQSTATAPSSSCTSTVSVAPSTRRTTSLLATPDATSLTHGDAPNPAQALPDHEPTDVVEPLLTAPQEKVEIGSPEPRATPASRADALLCTLVRIIKSPILFPFIVLVGAYVLAGALEAIRYALRACCAPSSVS
jgi:hypothetical protein